MSDKLMVDKRELELVCNDLAYKALNLDMRMAAESLSRVLATAKPVTGEPIGWTNEDQLGYLAEGGEAGVYPDQDHGCVIPVYAAPPAQEGGE